MAVLRRLLLSVLALVTALAPAAASGGPPGRAPAVTRLSSGLEGALGSTIGPDRALYVTEGEVGRISRVDPVTGDRTTFATGLPRRVVDGLGGAVDVAFIGRTAYVLVTLVGPDVGGSDIVGIYRVDRPHRFTVVADIGAYSEAHPPPPDISFFVPTGLQYAMEVFRGGFLVTDGHHNRVLRVTRDGEITEFRAFGNVVPTGLDLRGSTVYMAQAGPVPHLPEDGKVVSFRRKSSAVTEVASGARLAVDVEFGRGRSLFALSQGVFGGGPDGSPALPDTGALLRVRSGTMDVVVDGLDQPTSLEFLGDTAYVVTLTGEIWKVAKVARPPFGRPR